MLVSILEMHKSFKSPDTLVIFFWTTSSRLIIIRGRKKQNGRPVLKLKKGPHKQDMILFFSWRNNQNSCGSRWWFLSRESLAWGCQQLGNGSIVSGLVIPPSQQQQQQTSTSYNNHTRPMILKSVSLPLISLTRLSGRLVWPFRDQIWTIQLTSLISYRPSFFPSWCALYVFFFFFSLCPARMQQSRTSVYRRRWLGGSARARESISRVLSSATTSHSNDLSLPPSLATAHI